MRIAVEHLCRQSELPGHRLDVPDVAGHRLLEPFSPDRDTRLGGLKSGSRGDVAAHDGHRSGRERGGPQRINQLRRLGERPAGHDGPEGLG